MAVPFFRSSPFFRALVLTTGVFSFLLWLYTSMRVIVNGIDPPEPFLPGVRGLSFLAVGVFSFAMSFLCTLVYTWLWGRFARAAMVPPGWQDRRP